VKNISRSILIVSLGSSSALANVGACDVSLEKNIANVRIASATWIEPQSNWESPRGVVSGRVHKISAPFCRLEGVIEKGIVFELWLPQKQNWNGRYLGTGNGGDAGFINYDDLSRGVQRGFATSSTDTGHVRTDARWALHHPERVENFGHRAHHLLAEKSKALIDVYYGKRASHSYFIGCSGGGSQGMIEAQRYPYDYDGIISGASGNGMLPLSARILSSALYQEAHPEFALTQAQWSAVYRESVKACDVKDGIADGIVDDPSACSFDPAILTCGATSSAECLSPDQIKTVREAYAPLKDGSGVDIDPGFPPGAQFRPIPRQIGTAGLLFGDWTYQDEAWNPRNFNLARDVAEARKKFWFLMYPEADFSEFKKRGGKLLSYHGWMDEIVPPGLTIGVHEHVGKMFKDRTDDFYRLFLVPGMQHCSRGESPNEFGQAFIGDPPRVDAEHDALTAMVNWVERGVAPKQLIASRVIEGKVTMTRPICPYPQHAGYAGKGDTNDAKNFACR
jgi:feruloyl esterase